MMKYKTEDREWKEYNIVSLFKENLRGKRLKAENRQNGETPLVTAGENNNGIAAFINNEEQSLYKNAITIDMFGNAFYQESDFKCDDNITVLKNNDFSKYIYTFLVSSMKSLNKKYSYASQLRPKRFEKDKVMLPADSDGNPDWEFMENFMKERIEKKEQEIVKYYSAKVDDTVPDDLTLEGLEWGEFKIGDLFEFINKPSHGLNHLNQNLHGIPYVGATNKNNGVLTFVDSNEHITYDGNCIAFIRNGEGSMGYSIYKSEPFVGTQDITVGYCEKLNRYNGTFITTIADRVRGKYNFGYKRNMMRLKAETLHLPITNDDSPDWNFMENYMKMLEQRKIKEIIKYYT